MKQLVVLAYADEYRAAEVLAVLQRLDSGRFLHEDDAVCVTRSFDWSVKLHQGADLARADDRSRRFWRALIATLVLAPGTGDCRGTREDYGVSLEFERALYGALPPGSSAVFLIMTDATLEEMLPVLYRYGGTLLHTPFTASPATVTAEG